MTNTEELKKAIDDRGLKLEFICDRMGISYATLRRKINNESEFTASEITNLANLLNLTGDERDHIFFALEVN